MYRLGNTIFVLVFFSLFFLTAQAVDVKNYVKKDSLANREIPEIEVTSLTSMKLNLPFQSVNRDVLDSRVLNTPAEALQDLSGVSLVKDGIWATSLNIRGFSESKLLFLMDGDRIQTATDIAGALSTIDLGNVESIELIKGAASVLYGTGAMGGVVNFKYRKPVYTTQTTATGFLTSGFGSVNNLWQNHVNASLSTPTWYLSANASYRTAGNTTTPAGILNNSQFNDASWGLKGGMKQGENQELNVEYQHFQAWNTGIPGGSAFPVASTVTYLGFDRNQLNASYYIKNLSRTVKSVTLKVYNQNLTRSVENKVNATNLILPGSRNVTTGFKASTDLFFNDYHTLITGFDGWLRDQRTTRYKIVTVADTVVTGEQPTPLASMLDGGVFALYTWKPDPKYWLVNAGIRMDYIRTANDTAFREVFKYKMAEGEQIVLPANRTVLFNKGVNHALTYAMHLELIWKPQERQELGISIANAYRVASLEERFKYIEQGGKLMVGNPSLKPENGLFLNLNEKYKGSDILLNVNVFGNYLYNLIAEKLVKYTTVSGTQVDAWKNMNIAKACYYGGEVDLTWMIFRNFKFENSVSYVYGFDASNGNILPLIPPLHGNLSLQYSIQKVGGINTIARWVYEKDDAAHPGIAAHQNVVLDCFVQSTTFSIGRMYASIHAGVRNILNHNYTEHFSTLRGINKSEPGRDMFIKANISW